MGERNQGSCGDLAPTEVVVLIVFLDASRELVHEPRSNGRNDAGHEGGCHRGNNDLLQDIRPRNATHAQGSKRSTDEPAEQGVGRTGRDAQQPREEVPNDTADEPGENHEQELVGVTIIGKIEFVEVNDSLTHGFGDLDREESADQIEDRGEGHSDLGGQGTGGDGCRHGVTRVMEAVRKVKCESCGNDNEEDDQFCHTTIMVVLFLHGNVGK